MSIKQFSIAARTLKFALAGLASFTVQAVSAQDLYFIEHKATGSRAQICDLPLGTPVTSRPGTNQGPCVKFELIPNGDYFHIRSFDADAFIRPDTADDGSPISIQPNTWVGNWTQWSMEERGDGFGHLINRGTGKQIFLNARSRSDLELRPASWRGDFTRWRFVPVDGGDPIPAPVDEFVAISSNSEFGEFLVGGADSSQPGFTLYTFANDNGGPNSNCNGQCAVVWPPLLVDSANDLSGPANVNLGTTVRDDGTTQVTFNNEPIYFYQDDNAPGETNGHGVGGVWFVAQLGADVTPSPTPSASPTPTRPSTPTPTPTFTPSGPTPTPDPLRTPLVPATGDGGADFCLTTDGSVTHTDRPFRANFHFLCLNGSCQPASLENGVWVRNFGTLDPNVTYDVMTQIDDVPTQCNINANLSPGQCVASACLPADDTGPTVPGNLQLEGRNGQSVSVSWTASFDDRAVSRYEIFRNGRGIDFVSGSTLAFNDSGLDELTDYTYEVRACDGANNCSAFTPAETVNTGVFVPDTTPPTIPGTPTGEALSETEISLSWDPSFDEAGVVAGYRLTRDGSVITTINETSYTDTELRSGTAYTYAVVACDDSGNCSDPSGAATIETLKPDFSFLKWTYNKHDSTDVVLGISIRNHNSNQVGPIARNDGPDFLPTPINGSPASSHGFSFDISGNTLTWRWGGSIFRGPGDSGLEMHCSDDGAATYKSVAVSGGTATIPCTSSDYVYFFRYVHPLALNNNPASAYIYTAPFTIASRVDPLNYQPFTDGSANWMRFRHPVAHDGITAAVLDAQHNGDRLRHLDRYIIFVDDSPGNVQLTVGVDGNIVRNDVHRNNAGTQNGQQQFSLTQNPGFGNAFSYGQVIQFELTAVAGATGAQTYNDFSYYTVGYGWNAYGDPRLASAGKAGTTMWLSDNGTYSDIEYNAIFTQPVTTLNKEQDVDDFIVGHHLFHGIDPGVNGATLFDDPNQRIGERSCGDCHFRDGRGSEIIQTPRGPRLPPPTYGVKLLESIEGREVGFRWDGGSDTVAEQINAALIEDHKVNPNDLPDEVIRLITAYTEMLTVPNRDPGAYDSASVRRGDVVFTEIGCADCHTPVQKTRSDVEPQFANLTIRPYTDMRTWDLGEGSFRTAPLWGLGHNLVLLSRNNREALFMHDGGSPSIEHAIGRHGGTAASSRSAYESLSGSDKAAVVDFVKTL